MSPPLRTTEMLRRAILRAKRTAPASTPRAPAAVGRRQPLRGPPPSVATGPPTGALLPRRGGTRRAAFSSSSSAAAVPALRLAEDSGGGGGGGGDRARVPHPAPRADPSDPKEERREGSAGRDAGDATRRRERSHSKVVADELMRVFAVSDGCFHLTLKELNVNRASSSDEHQYRRFYADSLPSFGALLSGGDDDALAEVGLSAASAAGALDEFAAGAASAGGRQLDSWLEFSKKYRVATKRAKEREVLRANLERLRKRHAAAVDKWTAEEEDVKRMERKHTREKDHVAALGEQVASTEKMLPSLRDGGELDQIERELMSALAQLDTLASSKTTAGDLAAQKRRAAEAKRAAAKLAKRVRTQETLLGATRWDLSEEDARSAAERLARTARAVAPALARHIALRDEDFAKYRELAAHTDLTRPHEWYPRARLERRRIVRRLRAPRSRPRARAPLTTLRRLLCPTDFPRRADELGQDVPRARTPEAGAEGHVPGAAAPAGGGGVREPQYRGRVHEVRSTRSLSRVWVSDAVCCSDAGLTEWNVFASPVHQFAHGPGKTRSPFRHASIVHSGVGVAGGGLRLRSHRRGADDAVSLFRPSAGTQHSAFQNPTLSTRV